jgi:shikimate kinase
MHSRIYLIGFMGSGKTTHGKQIARMMGYDFLDMDQWIAEKEGKSIPEIFAEEGESRFRELETAAIKETDQLQKVIIATGGGLPCRGDNMQMLKASGLTIYLKLTPKALLSRLKVSKTQRPLLEGKSEEEMYATIREMLVEREPWYSQADMTIEGLEKVNERVVNAIQRQR